MLYLQLGSYNINVYPVVEGLPTLLCSLKPHFRQVLYAKGMVYIILSLVSSFTARDLGAKQLPELAK